jgi:hypothetical protein
MKRVHTIYNYLLVGFGLALILSVIIPTSPLSVVSKLSPAIINTFPSGNSSTPTIISPNSKISLYADISYGARNVFVKIRCNSTGYAEEITLQPTNISATYPEGKTVRYVSQWQVPDRDSVIYRFDWFADSTNTTTYAIASSGVVEGFFTVNGYAISNSETIWLNTTKVKIEYWAIKNFYSISRVAVKVRNGTAEIVSFELSKDPANPNHWVAEYEIPKEQNYVIEGYIVYGQNEYKQLSLYLNYIPPPRFLSVKSVYQITFICVGVVCLYFGVRGKSLKVRKRR